MSNVKYTTTHRLLSVILSVVMVIAAIPFSAISAFAGDLPKIEGITVESAGNLKYDDGQEQTLKVTVEGTQEGDVVYYSATGEDGTWSGAELTGTDAKNYTVFVKVVREGYEEWISDPVLVVIETAEITGVSVESAGDLICNGENQNLEVTVNGAPSGSTYQYRLESDSEFSPNFPQGKEEGAYPVYVKVSCENYAEEVFGPATVIIYTLENQATLNFTQSEQNISVDNEAFTDGYQVDMSVTVDNAPVDGTVTYSVIVAEGEATINADTGMLTVTQAGTYTVSAVLDCGPAYKTVKKTFVLGVQTELSEGQHYYMFVNESGEMISGTSFKFGESVPAVRLVKTKNNMPSVTYTTDNAALSVDQKGKVSYDNTKLAEALEANGNSIVVKVTASSKAGGYFKNDDSVFYMITVSFEDLPAEPYTVSGDKAEGKEWYTSDVTVTPADGYKIAKAGDKFAESLTISDEGTTTTKVYLQNADTGTITAPLNITVSIDKTAADADDVTVEWKEIAVKDVDSAHYVFLDEATLTFTATDATSGVSCVKWQYIPEGETDATVSDSSDFVGDKATVSLNTGDRGTVEFIIVDIAGNETATYTAVYDKNNEDKLAVFVLDEAAPQVDVQYNFKNEDGTTVYITNVGDVYYYDAAPDATVKFVVDEANFFEDEFQLTMKKDGEDCKDYTLSWAEDEENGNHVGKLSLNGGDGEYTFAVDYKDTSGKNAVYKDSSSTDGKYNSYTLVVDTTLPVVSIVNDDNPQKQTVTFTVTERHFDPEKVKFEFNAKDITGKYVAGNDTTKASLEDICDEKVEWTPVEGEKDTYSFTTGSFKNGIYDAFCTVTDLSDNEGTASCQYTIDHSAPVVTSIEYGETTDVNWLEKIFYNKEKTITVTFEATDDTTAVETFEWSYAREEGASETNLEKCEGTVAAVATQNLNTYTATITLPLKEAEQLRGSLIVTATDTYGNKSAQNDDDGNVIVVDTVSPKMTVEYDKAVKAADDSSVLYYDTTSAKATFTVTEANFDSGDVEVTATKDGKQIDTVLSWKDNSVDEHVGTLTFSGDGHYDFTVAYKDKSGNEMKEYTSNTMVLDTTKPVIDVQYDKPLNSTGRTYLQNKQTQKATITITERNFDAQNVKLNIVAKDVAGADVTGTTKIDEEWASIGNDQYVKVVTFNGDANYTFNLTCSDLAKNEAQKRNDDEFTVDKTDPEIKSVEYSEPLPDALRSGISCGFYNAKVTVTVTATDATSGVDEFLYSYILASGVSKVNAELRDQIVNESEITYTDGGKTATITFTIPKNSLTATTQFNGTVDASATDRCGNSSGLQKYDQRLIVDNIAPKATVTFNDPVATTGGVAYYNGAIKGTITITEANFDANDVKVSMTKNGASQSVAVNWTDVNVDTHIGTFTLSDDADYVVDVTYTDKSNNTMTPYKSGKMTVDTKISAPTFTINGKAVNGNGGAYTGDVNVGFNFSDQNYSGYSEKDVTLTRIRFDKKDDVKKEFVNLSLNDKGGVGSFDIPKTTENDGIYILTVKMADKAQHSETSQLKFTVNRFGSVYEYSDYLCALIADGGQYREKITEDLVVTEYNASPFTAGSLKVMITKDGEALDKVVTEEDDPKTESGWYKHVYVIKQSNFAEDGVYKITISSSDATGNTSTSVPDDLNKKIKGNSVGANGDPILDVMSFTVDDTDPEIRNIVNLENAIAKKSLIKDGKLTVEYALVDVGGLAKVEIFINGELVDTVDKFDNNQAYNGSFVINESNDIQTVRMVVTDLAGNVTDTASETFNPGDLYVFNDEVTVSTDFLVRFYRNTPLFWGSIGGVVAVLGGVILLIAKKKKKTDKSDKTDKE